MTQDEMVELAKQANFEWLTPDVRTLILLAVAKEREAIEKLFEEVKNTTDPHKDYEDYDDGWVDACYACKWAVRARGEA